MSKVYIAIIGTGGVGKAFVSQLQNYIKICTTHTLIPILISRSTKALISNDYSPLDLTTWETSLSASQTPPPTFPAETHTFLTSAPGPVILIDNTSSDHVASSYPLFLSSGIHIATPNKKPFSGPLKLFQQIYSSSTASGGGMIYHESSVGAGLPVISTLKDLLATGDKVLKIEGVFSGTMSFLFNSFAPLTPPSFGTLRGFSECVKEARKLGYTEPDPRDDLNGLDVARKLTILARICGVEVPDPTSFPIQSLIPKPLESAATAEEFLEGLSSFDGDMQEVRRSAEASGGVVRYAGSIDVSGGDLSVGCRTFERASAVAGLRGSDNVIAFYTLRYGERALVIQGAGAGGDVTAMGVLGDVIKILERLG